MISISLKQLACVTEGVLYQINDYYRDNLWINVITTDTRYRKINSLFIALKGKNFDGHHFIEEAICSGAKALLVDHPLPVSFPQIIVENTRLAMGKLAAWIRLQSKAKVIGLTGSSGKTSVKEMVANILSYYTRTLFTHGNFNNDIGVALTLFRLMRKHQYIVIEMGANHIGEIKYATNIIKPNSVLVNNLFAAHLEGFSSLAGVSKAKGEIFQGLAKKGIAVINLASHDWKNWRSDFTQQQTIWRFSIIKNQQADFYAKNIFIKSIGSKFELHTPIGVVSILLPLPGKHNIANALAASALAISVGATLKQVSFGLLHTKPILGRLYPVKLAPGKLILDDTYNANIGSMISAVNVLSKMPGYRILVVSDMKELGDKTDIYHKKVGDIVRQMKFDKVFSVGKQSAIISQQSGCGEHFIFKKKLIANLILLIQEHEIISILVKGSQNTEMKEIIFSLKEYFSC
ncbi:MAG: UDP-N-acetylmuramoyl-tripeptide--D-alanyl-D-alanine ligase [Arsenophonus sp. ET-DL9-MAG3]